MDSTAVVAVSGLISTMVAGWFSASWQRRANREDRLLEARVRTYGDCAIALYEYERLTYRRALSRLDQKRPESLETVRDETSQHNLRVHVRDEAYQANSRLNSSIGQIALISQSENLTGVFQKLRASIQAMGSATDRNQLREQQGDVLRTIERVLESARMDLTKPSARDGRRRLGAGRQISGQ